MNFTNKQKREREKRIERLRGRTEGLGKINDWKTRKAKENFHRPAFKGAELEAKHDFNRRHDND